MTTNTVLEQGDLNPELPSGAVTPQLSAAASADPSGAAVIDPVRSLAEAWYASSVTDWSTPVSRPFDAQYWACWLVTLVLPAVIAYLLLVR